MEAAAADRAKDDSDISKVGVPAAGDIVFENETYDPGAEREWINVTVRHQQRAQETIGSPTDGENPRFDTPAAAFVQIFTEVRDEEGAKRADDLSLWARSIFDAKRIPTDDGSLIFQAATFRERGPDGRWNSTIVEAPFKYEDRGSL